MVGLAVALLFAVLSAPGTAHAQETAPSTFYVTRFDDPPPDGCLPDDCSLREAVIAANAVPNVKRILLPLPGTYTLTRVGGGEDAAQTGDLDVTEGLAIRGLGPAGTVIDAGGLDRIFDVSNAEHALTLELSRLSLSNGHAIASATDGGDGGAIRALASLELIDIAIRGSVADGSGGGVFAQGEWLGMVGGVVENNEAVVAGGGIYSASERTHLSGGTFRLNTADEGGAFWTSATEFVVRGSAIDGNSARRGGGGFFGDNVIARAEAVRLANNVALEDGGAAFGGGALDVHETTIEGNEAGRDGGGIYAEGSLNVTNSTLSGNSAGRGGAVISFGAVEMENTTVSGNSAGIVGGVFVDRGAASLRYVTIAENTSETGSGANLGNDGGAVTIANSIVAGAGADNCGGEIESLGYNLDSGASCGFAAAGDVTNADPMLAPLADNGGRTWTHALLDGSAALDIAGDCNLRDQRGLWRPQDGDSDDTAACDAGAFERQDPRCLPRGDANHDGRTNAIDAFLILQYEAELIEDISCSADVNIDGIVYVSDATIVLQISAGLFSPPFPN